MMVGNTLSQPAKDESAFYASRLRVNITSCFMIMVCPYTKRPLSIRGRVLGRVEMKCFSRVEFTKFQEVFLESIADLHTVSQKLITLSISAHM